MKLQDVISNSYLIEELNRHGNDIIIELDPEESDTILITVGIYRRARHKKSSLTTIYAELKEKCPVLATKIMSLLFGSKNET